MEVRPKPKRKVIYLTGLDRSGSTITGAVLGAHPEIAFFGELQYYPKAVLSNRFINQQQRMGDVPFWLNINKCFTDRFGENAFENFCYLKNRYERWRNLPILFFHFLVKNSKLKKYWEYNFLLIDELLGNSSKCMICDSSKNIVRRIALGLSGAYQFYTILLIRDARGYCWSRKSKSLEVKDQHAFTMAIVKWVTNNAMFAIVSVLGNFMTIRYEILYGDPLQNFAKIGKKLKLELSVLYPIITSKKSFAIANMIAGNPGMRRGKELIVQIDESWKKGLTIKEKRVILFFTGWLLWLFGYSLDDSST